MITNVAGSSRHIQRDLKEKQPKIVKSATVTALNRANSKVFTEAKRGIRSKTGVPLKHYKSYLKKFPAKFIKLRSRVWMSVGRKLSLGKVNTGKKINKKWLHLVDKKSLDGQSIQSAFRAVTQNNHSGIYVRKQKSSSATGRDRKGRLKKGRLPISQVTLDISEKSTLAILEAGKTYSRPVFENSLRHEIARRQKNIGSK